MNPLLEQNKTESFMENTSTVTQEFGLDNSTERHFYFHVSANQIPFVITGVILFAIGFVGNSLTLISLTCFKELRTRYYALVGSLSASGLLMSLVVPLNIFSRQECIFPDFWFITEVLKSSLYLIAALHMINIAGERFIVIKYPMKHKIILSVKRLKIFLFFVWFIPILFVIFNICFIIDPVSVFKEGELHRNNCVFGYTIEILDMCAVVIAYGISNVTLLILSIKIMIIYRKNARKMAGSIHVRNSKYSQRKQLRLSVTLAIVKVMFLVTYTPIAIVKVIQVSNSNLSAESLKSAKDVADIFAFSSSAANFLIYIGRIKAFRKAYRKICLCRCCEKLY